MATPPKHIIRCGLNFDPWMSKLEVEFEFIRAGGYIEIKGKKYGEGLFAHYRMAQTIRWPDEDHHTWSDLILENILKERLTVTQGSRDSSKTRTYVKYALIDYWCFPKETLFLISSTDVRGLELRVWGDLKDLWDRDRDKFEWLAGNPVDSKHGIFTDGLDEGGEIRDMRKGIICFVPETLVDTPSGQVKIEDVCVGDEVINACGVGRVKASGFRYAPEILRVALSDGRFVDCTPEHPFFTDRGWTKAVDLKILDRVFSAHETMFLLQSSPRARLSQSEILLQAMSGKGNGEGVQAMPSKVSTLETKARPVLPLGVRGEMGSGKGLRNGCSFSWVGKKMPSLQKKVHWAFQPALLFAFMPTTVCSESMCGMRENVSVYSALKNKAEDSVLRSILQMEMEQPQNRKEGASSDRSRNKTLGFDSGHGFTAQDLHWPETKEEYPASLHRGFGNSEDEDCNRDGRRNSQASRSRFVGQEKGHGASGAWVVSVAFLQSSGDSRFEKHKGGYRVHNLEVEGHPSYSANGIIVHNCVPVLDSQGNETKLLEKFVGIKQKRRRLLCDEAQFLPARYLSILANVDKGDFKSGFTGNPLGQKALDKVAEPECGWSNHPEPNKTTTWRNKFDGVTINLVGPDSPNFDPNRPKNYSYLINQDDVDRVQKRFGPDSVEFYSQIKGVRKSGLNPRIVLTDEMCKLNGAYDECVWGHEEITSVLGIDAGYGGDACETIHIQFGKNAQGYPIIKFHEPEVIPINLNEPATPEDQIAMQAKRLCEIKKIPFANVFFEAGMRASLAISLARILGPEVNAVNAGGPATTRPVSDDLFVDDPDKGIGSKRLKRCDEHYSKFITEQYFSVRFLVECKQARELPKSAVTEFSEREWVWARGTRYELETKEDFKERCHYSPNKADATAIAVEGARRLGFMIARIKTAKESEERQRDDWLERELNKHRASVKKRGLTYA